ncbi:hypothetical protein EJ05DRAFT_286215 [Pseudovirgaria hyperparasitica]|uniref:Stc1 domain-containing protein n=1 Tax=Pseudovirgaria hyperparasitica TaxID=470096 RepID=A0A6A6WH50_9PEZI|nr:uncharacterized protein EJ05DRAFT_286215 [Pseudovirgaria hyperparasitica]KAF2760481.1 hypothetical protein EJ05DRAFT_286215 [Pseudovirgaria hyperparasitica]
MISGSNSGGGRGRSFGGYNSGPNNGLPSKIKCYKCNKPKTVTAFSTKQRENAQSSVRCGRPIQIACVECNQQTVVEITCIECKVTKSVPEFSKAQAKETDTARCFKCVEERTTMEAQKSDSDDDDAAYSADDDDDDATSFFLSSIPSQTGRATSNNGSGVAVGPVSSPSVSSYDDTRDGFMPYKTKSYISGQTAGKSHNRVPMHNWAPGRAQEASRSTPSIATGVSLLTQSGFNPRGYGHPGSSTAPSVSGSEWGSTNTERNSTRNVTGAKHRAFAKVKAYKPPKKEELNDPSDNGTSDSGESYDSDI